MGVSDFVTGVIGTRVKSELRLMAEALHQPMSNPLVERVLDSIEVSLTAIEKLLASEAIVPSGYAKSSGGAGGKSARRRLRIGFYPLAGNPIHWGHICIGLAALAALKLDKVVYVIAGDDPRKPDLVPHVFRYAMGVVVSELCAPLLEQCDIAAGTDFVGEDNLFRFLRLYAGREIDVFYIAGGDHYRRVNPVTHEADTIQRIEDNITKKVFVFDAEAHRVSAVFVERGSSEEWMDSFLRVHFLPGMPFAASSTMIREAFWGKRDRRDLLLMPFSAYLYAQGLGLYGARFLPGTPRYSNAAPGWIGELREGAQP